MLLQMLADFCAVHLLDISDQPQNNAHDKYLVITGLQEVFGEYMASKGGRAKETQNAFDVTMCAIMSVECTTAGLSSAMAELFHLRYYHLDKAQTQRHTLKDEKDWRRVKQKERSDKCNL